VVVGICSLDKIALFQFVPLKEVLDKYGELKLNLICVCSPLGSIELSFNISNV
jgi:hypothetical protein